MPTPEPGWLPASWPAPPGVRAGTTTRVGGVSDGPWRSLNLATHVGDAPASVARNRARLRAALDLPAEPAWLEQVHGARVTRAASPQGPADGAVALAPGAVCAVLTADCVPLLLARRDGSAVAAVHAGWRGLAAGVVASAVRALAAPPGSLAAWIGPCIGPCHYEIDAPVRQALEAGGAPADAFTVSRPGHWRADLAAIADAMLAAAGVEGRWQAQRCTACEPGQWFSHRRDRVTGRMASLIWIERDRQAPAGGRQADAP